MNLTCCPRECPRRSVSCHNGCQTYMRYKLMRKSREYDAADNIAGLERCVKTMVVLGLVGIAAAVAFVAM